VLEDSKDSNFYESENKEQDIIKFHETSSDSERDNEYQMPSFKLGKRIPQVDDKRERKI
jgi:hypothetical protein